MSAYVQVWRLREPREAALGLCCTADGLMFGGVRLIERHHKGYAIRSIDALDRLFAAAYDRRLDAECVLPGLAIARALNAGDLCRASIAAVHLRLPELPDPLAHVALLLEDAALRLEQRGVALLRWDADEHPRTGVPPNPGWFAPEDGGTGQGRSGRRPRRGEFKR